MRELETQELKVGDLVLIDLPRTQWDHREGKLFEIRQDPCYIPRGHVILDGIARAFPLTRLRLVK